LLQISQEKSTQPKVIIFNAGLHEIGRYCTSSPGWDRWRSDFNVSKSDIKNCAVYYRNNFRRLLDLIVSTFPSDLKVFRTTNAAWMRWGNFGFAWPPKAGQSMVESSHVVRMFNDIAIDVIRESRYDIKVYDLFWMTWSRPDDTEINTVNDIGNHMVHLGHDSLKVSLRKLFTIISEHFSCFV